MPSGYLYILSNTAMPGLLKIGRTDREPELRARELHTTGVPTPFVLEHYVEVVESSSAERQVHELLGAKGARMSPDREFFDVTLADAIEILELVSSKLPTKPDFSLGTRLAELAAAVVRPSGKDSDRGKVDVAADRLIAIARRGYPPAMRWAAELFDDVYPSAPRFKDIWREYLELMRAEATWHPLVASNGRELRMSVGRAVAEYIYVCSAHQWLIDDDFVFISTFLIRGDEFQYEGYVNELSRYRLPAEIASRACNV